MKPCRRVAVLWDSAHWKLEVAETSPVRRASQGAGLPRNIGQEPVEFRLDYLIALTRPRLQPRAIYYGDLAPAIMNQPGVLQLPSGLGDTFAAHAQHVGDQLLRHGQFVRG